MRGKLIGAAVVTALLGVGGGAAAAYMSQPDLVATGTPSPIPAAGPSVPSDPDRKPLNVLPDLDYPALVTPTLSVRHVIGNDNQMWAYYVPRGWTGECILDSGSLPIKQAPDCTEVRWRPADEDAVGGYSLRVKSVADHESPADERHDRVRKIENSSAIKQVDLLRTSDSAAYLSLLQAYGDGYLLRYNFFRWFTAPDSSVATLEMSVTGRSEDQDGLYGLFDAFAAKATALPAG